jgi:hypothetical protein
VSGERAVAGKAGQSQGLHHLVTTFSYDGIGRPTGRTYSDGTPALTIVYDDDARTVTLTNGADTVTRRYETSGALASESSAANASTVSYTHKGGILRETATLDGRVVTYGYEGDYLSSLESGGRAFGLEYDDVGRRTHLTYPNGLQAVSRYVEKLPWLEGIRLEGAGRRGSMWRTRTTPSATA